MKSALGLLIAVAGVAAGWALQVRALEGALQARRQLHSELSATTGRARQADAIAQQWADERGEGSSAAELIAIAARAAPTALEKKLWEATAACALDAGCPRKAAIERVEKFYLDETAIVWAANDRAEAEVRKARAPSGARAIVSPVIVLVIFVSQRRK
jgi:hypothetical protein